MLNSCIGSRTWVRVWVWVNHQGLPQTKGLVMSKKNSRYSYGDFHFSLVDAKGSEYPIFDPSDPYGIGGTYDVCIDTWQYDYQNFTIHSAVRELKRIVKQHGNSALGKDFFIKSLQVSVFDNQNCVHTDLSNDKVQELLALVNPNLFWVDNKI